MQPAVVDDEPADRPLRVLDREEDLAVARRGGRRGRRSGRRPRRRRASGRARAGPRPRPRCAARRRRAPPAPRTRCRRARWPRRGPARSSSRSRGTSLSPTRRAMPPKSAVSSAWRARSCLVPERLRSRCRRRAASKPVAVDAHAVLGRQLDGQVDGEAVRVVEAEGRLAVEARGVLGHVLGPAAHDAVGARQRDERLLELDGARVERPGEGGLLAHDGAQDGLAPLAQDGVGLAHEVDDDLGGLRQEGLAAAQQPAVAHGAADDAAQDVAAALVGGQHAVGDEEGDGPRVVGDDLVAEALRSRRRPGHGRGARACGRGWA